jgi:predicted GNAT family N-acyltransferase
VDSDNVPEGGEEYRYRFEVLSNEHKPLRGAFRCGEEALDGYLQRQARQDMERGLSVAHLLLDKERERIAGYYTLSSGVIRRGELPEELDQGLGKNRVFPALLLGRLAVDIEYQGKGLGRELLLDALYRALELSRTSLGAVAVTVDALDDKAREFYARYGFEQLGTLDAPEQNERVETGPSDKSSPDNTKVRLYLPMKSIARLS